MAAPTRSVIYYIGADRFMYEYVPEGNGNRCVKKSYSIPPWMDLWSAVASYNEMVVIVGGLNRGEVNLVGGLNPGECDKRAVLINMGINPKDQQLPDLPETRYGSGVVLLHKEIYVVGGFNKDRRGSDSVYYLSAGMNAWQARKSMPFAVSHALVIQHRHSVFVLGGQSGNHIFLNSVLKYNIANDTWKRCSDMLVHCNSYVAGVVVYEGRIKVITVDQCVTYDVDNDVWYTELYKKLGGGVNAFVYRGQICAVVQNGDIWSIMRYDDKFNVWKTEYERIDQAWCEKFFC